ncbi:MAG: molybdenum cofactor biosynthesis protein MoaE [Dehalococcoidales bacterium]|jgi:molybdopterin synthase catalytic subunit|nr:molybdenum cofactor biosynthesis protein MoaE [Dehalococcoidales bacterium]MDD4230399.1 molybdenum cofactor biosynthesis protein MoaE [Dehalococcoidales bacterium]MDD4465622.1 molybdenum cofactor biosynthesis protein MoaE [Dehalococcoidales bacterium]MDD5402104.1 molybdenum cofactor biosynthesis protein MoaE [Dehalococcoidales bacterium]
MIAVTSETLSPEEVVRATKTDDSGCVCTYVGLIRDNNRDKMVEYVEYSDKGTESVKVLQSIVDEAREKYPVNEMSLVHRTGKLKVGDINLVIAVAAGHRKEAFEACAFAVDEFKARRPTDKTEKYLDGTASSAF